MNEDKVQSMLRLDRIAWDALVSLLDVHPGESLHGTGSPPWNSRDVYAHFARWMDRSNAHIEAYCAGKKLPELPASPEKMNDIWQQEDSIMTLAEARAKAMDAFARRMEIIAAIPPGKWNLEMDKIVSYDGAAHYTQHMNYIVATKK